MEEQIDDIDAQREQNMITHGRGSGASLGGDTTRGRSRRNARRSGPASTTATGLGNNNNESTNLSAHGQRRTQVLVTTSNAAQVPQIIPHRRVHHGSDVYRTPPFARNTEGNRQEWLRAGPLGVAVTLHDARAAWTYRFDSEERLYATVNPFALQPGSRNQQPRQGQGSTADPDRPLDGPRSPYVPPDASAVWNMDSDEFRDFQDRMEFELERTERTQWRPQNVRPASNMPKPSALTTEQMMVERQCKICWEQLATVATLPCGHCIMCKWCAEKHVPSHPADRTRPAPWAAVATCPICREPIRSRHDLYFS